MNLKEIVIGAVVGSVMGYNLHSSTREEERNQDVVYELKTEKLEIRERVGSDYDCMIGSMNTATKVSFLFDNEIFWLETDFGVTDSTGRKYDDREIIEKLSPLFGVNNKPQIEITAIPLAEEQGKRVYDVLEFSLEGITYTRFINK